MSGPRAPGASAPVALERLPASLGRLRREEGVGLGALPLLLLLDGLPVVLGGLGGRRGRRALRRRGGGAAVLLRGRGAGAVGGLLRDRRGSGGGLLRGCCVGDPDAPGALGVLLLGIGRDVVLLDPRRLPLRHWKYRRDERRGQRGGERKPRVLSGFGGKLITNEIFMRGLLTW